MDWMYYIPPEKPKDDSLFLIIRDVTLGLGVLGVVFYSVFVMAKP